jgi:hypothetical protein
MTSAEDDGEELLDDPERADHPRRVEAILRTFLVDSCFFTVAPGTRTAPLVAVRLGKSTRSFSLGQAVYVYDGYWGMNEHACVVGRHRRKHRFIRGVCPIASLVDPRPKIVYAPAVLRKLEGATIDGSIFTRFCNLPGDFMYFDDYRKHILETPIRMPEVTADQATEGPTSR